MNPDISVVVPTRDRCNQLERLLESLSGQTLDRSRFDVFVVDDNSSDRTRELIERARRDGAIQLQAITRSIAGGPAAARNDGWRAARGSLVAFTDDDCEPSPSWLEEILQMARAHPGAVVQGRTEPNPMELDRLGPFSRTIKVEDLGPWYPTCNIAYPRELLQRLGGFEESFRRGEDTDLAWRAMSEDTRMVFADQALVHHAVNQFGPLEKLHWSLGWADGVHVFRQHPGLRKTLYLRIFWRRSHALLALAIVGGLASRRFRPAALLALPYLRDLRGRCLGGGSPLYLAPYLGLEDAAELLALAWGDIRYRTVVL